jgi:hypothetical protein
VKTLKSQDNVFTLLSPSIRIVIYARVRGRYIFTDGEGFRNLIFAISIILIEFSKLESFKPKRRPTAAQCSRASKKRIGLVIAKEI